MRVVSTLRKWTVITFVMFLIIVMVIPSNSFARKEARYEIKTGDAIYGFDLGTANDTQKLFHQQTLQSVDNESLNINFPLSPSTLLGKTANGSNNAVDGAFNNGSSMSGGMSTTNIIPFGETDLVFPSISQNVDQSYNATSTGFYSSTFLGLPPVNTGAALVASGPDMPISPTRPPVSIAGPNMPFPEMVDTTPGTDRAKAMAETSKNDNSTSTNKTKSLVSIPLNVENT